MVLLAIIDLLEGVRAKRETIATLFGLTSREAEFGEFFSYGHDIEQISSLMGVSPNTARVHLRRVLAKTGAVNQVQLSRILATVP